MLIQSFLPLFSRSDYPVRQFGGTKSVVISTVSWIGGKQPFLGWSYVAVAALCVLLAVIGTIKHLIRPRKMGDMSSESLRHAFQNHPIYCENKALIWVRYSVVMESTQSTSGKIGEDTRNEQLLEKSMCAVFVSILCITIC